MFEVFISSVSGGFFISQIAAITKILSAREKSDIITKTQPDVYFGASGGNLSNYLALIFNKNKESVEKVLYKFNSKMFVRNWWPEKLNFFHPLFLSIFNSSIYKEGKGSEEIFKKNYTQDHILEDSTPEIWTLTHNIDTNLGSLNCSKTQEKSIFSEDLKLEELIFYGCGEINYLGGDIEKIIKTNLASASIPGIKGSVEIDGNKYVDGGITDATPYGFFGDVIYNKFQEKELELPFHCFFILPLNLKNISDRHTIISKKEKKHWISMLFENLDSVFSSMIFNHRKYALENWFRCNNISSKNIKIEFYYHISLEDLQKLLEKYHHVSYFITCYTDVNQVDITKFDSKDLKEKFEKSFKSLSLELIIKDG
jgi:hypothetical protein